MKLAELYADEGYYARRAMDNAAILGWQERAKGIVEHLGIRPRSVLDLGAGYGHLVYALGEMGMKVEGVEASAVARAAARELYGVELHSGIGPELHGRFELVTLIHSLEHVLDPVAALTEAAMLLGPTGRVFIEVPHAGSVEMWRPRRRREILDLPAHLYHFVPETLSLVAERAGLRVVRVRLWNASAVDWVLSFGERRRPTSIRETSEKAGSSELQDSSHRRPRLAHRVLRSLRERFPGWKFQVLAARIQRP